MVPRRIALERISLILGGSLTPQLAAGLQGQVLNTGESLEVSEAQKALLAEVADVIIPDTDTPGAKAAGAHEFIIRVMRDCHVLEEQETFYAGLERIAENSRKLHEKEFADLAPEQKDGLIEDVSKKDGGFFRRLKSLTMAGYFTSEIGATQALEYLPIPGKFEGDVPLQPGQKTWAIPR